MGSPLKDLKSSGSKIPRPNFAHKPSSSIHSFSEQENSLHSFSNSKLTSMKKLNNYMSNTMGRKGKKPKHSHTLRNSLKYEPKLNYTITTAYRRDEDVDDSVLKSVTNENELSDVPPEHYQGETPKRLSKRLSQDGSARMSAKATKHAFK